MNILAFQLWPFATCSKSKGPVVTGAISRTGQELHLLFRLSGDLDSLIVAGTIPEPSRCQGLWQTTCFECFFRRKGSVAYHELNISPNGCWNLYHFSDYRMGMREELAVAFSSEGFRDDSVFEIRCTLLLDDTILPVDTLEVGISCVLEQSSGEKSYWALSHPGQQPDFHHPDGFHLKL